MPPARTVRRLPGVLAAPLLLIAFLCLLLFGVSGARAQRSRPACGASASAHARALHACAKRQTRRHKSHGRHAKPHRKRAAKPKGKAKTPSKQPALQAPAECEDGTTPAPSGEGQFSCADGSEPTCEDGSEPAVSHGKLTCAPDPETGPTFGEGECEAEEGVCGAEMRPVCEDGSNPTFSSEGDILSCEAAQSEDEED